MKNKTVAALLAIFLGGLGIHKFYLGRTGWGIVYLIFCWTIIPSIVGFIEGIIYLTMSEQSFNAKYNLVNLAVQHLSSRPEPVAVTINQVPNIQPTTHEWTKFNTTVAGFQYHDAPKIIDSLIPGTRLTLERDYGNQYDDNAVKIMLGESFLGFIPRNEAERVADALQEEYEVYALIKRLDQRRDDYEKLSIEVRRKL